MTEKYLKTLEFDKITAMAAQYITCPQARALLLGTAPGESAQEVRELLARTDAITSLLIKNGSPRFSGVREVENTVQRAAKGGVLSMAELLQYAQTLRNFANLVAWYHITEHDMLPVDELFYMITPQPALEKNIFEAILSETEMSDTASDTLYAVRRKIRATENSIRDKLDSMTKSQSTSKYLQDAVVSIRNGRFVVPVKVEHRSDVGGVIHDVSSSGSTLFVEPTAVVEANAKIMQLHSQEQAEIERILAAFSSQVAEQEPLFTPAYSAMLQLDVLLAKARLACDEHAAMPQVREDCCFSLVRARHPLIPRERAVPIHVQLGQEYDTLVVTGPNTGGKTVTLKTAGLLSCMAQHGYLIPAHESSEVCVFSDILADIGDEQSIEQSLSTFSGHMKNITGILAQAGPRTLVLMDELGAGTDPAEGAALAVSILEALRRRGARIMATTHYAELKLFALDTPGVQNASCEFDVETLRPTYRISVGVPGKSNAFLIGEKLGIPSEIIQTAQRHLSAEDRQFDAILVQLEDMKKEVQESHAEIERLKHAAVYELEKAQAKRAELIAQGETELEAAREKARGMAQSVQNDAYRLMDEMRKLEKDAKQSASQRAQRAKEIARRESEQLFARSDVAHETVRDFTPLKSVSAGQEVLVVALDKIAVVQALPDRNGFVSVRAGAIKTKVPLSGLAAAPKLKQPQKQTRRVPQSRAAQGVSGGGSAPRTPAMEINLIGLSVEEAIGQADKFIDDGVMSGLSTVYLIHGKGTGALRKGIHAHLRGHRSVNSFRLGTYGEGETGVTVVELK